MTRSKPSDVLGRMKAAATREKPVSTTPTEAVEPSTGETVSALPASPPRVRPVRFTLDLEPSVHKNLKRFALEADADASEVMRALLALLHTDTQVRNAVLTALSRD